MMKNLLHIAIVICSLSAWGQEDASLSLVTSKNKIEIGSPITASVRFTYPANMKASAIVFPIIEAESAINDTLEVWDAATPVSEIDTQNGLVNWQQDFTIAAFYGGAIQLGPFYALINGDTLFSNVATLSVSMPEVDEKGDFKGIKAIEKDPFTLWEKIMMFFTAYWLWMVIVVALIAIALVVNYILKRRAQREVYVPRIPLPITLFEKLEAIEAQELWQAGKHKLYYSEVTNVIRKLLEHKFQIQAMEQTSDEILSSLRLSTITKDELTELTNLFELSDMIKFAKSKPVSEENITAMKLAKSLVKREIPQG